MTFEQRKDFCDNIIAPYREQLSDKILAELYKICKSYDEDDVLDIEQKFEIGDTVCYILDREGFPIYADMKKDND